MSNTAINNYLNTLSTTINVTNLTPVGRECLIDLIRVYKILEEKQALSLKKSQ